jgi:hypothetical protein
MRLLPLAVLLAVLLAGQAWAATPRSYDFNGDGLADVALPDYIESIDSQGVSVIFGRADRTPPEYTVAPGDRGLRITIPDQTIEAAELMGDVNGDGLADLLITEESLGIFVVYGRREPGELTLTDQLLREGTQAIGKEWSSTWSRAAGDVNGDGLGDLLHRRDGKFHKARIRFGARTGQPLRKGFVINAKGRLGGFVNPLMAPVGDVNGDGRDDVAIAVQEPGGRAEGFDFEEMVFVVFGKRDRHAVTLVQDGGQATARVVTRAGKRAGFAVHDRAKGCFCQVSSIDPAGDVNGDERGDFVITWMDPFSNRRPRNDVVLGRRKTSALILPGRGGRSADHAQWVTPPIVLSGRLLVGSPSPHGYTPFRRPQPGPALISGGYFSYARPAGDVDGDGFADVLVGWSLKDKYAVLYGAATLSPFDIRNPGTAATLLICKDPPGERSICSAG